MVRKSVKGGGGKKGQLLTCGTRTRKGGEDDPAE